MLHHYSYWVKRSFSQVKHWDEPKSKRKEKGENVWFKTFSEKVHSQTFRSNILFLLPSIRAKHKRLTLYYALIHMSYNLSYYIISKISHKHTFSTSFYLSFSIYLSRDWSQPYKWYSSFRRVSRSDNMNKGSFSVFFSWKTSPRAEGWKRTSGKCTTMSRPEEWGWYIMGASVSMGQDYFADPAFVRSVSLWA